MEISINMTTPQQYFLVIIFLLARATLLVGQLSGEHLCHKRETYTVTMRVIVKEPVQVKSYTWCLKVPPRCTKYKIELRDKFKIQTELRERVVDFCCAGYAPDRTETHCLPICNGCVHGVCATPESCTCEPGYKGDRCEIECEEGRWGTDCEQKCSCLNGAECHHVTGDCKCADGWRGSECDKPCPRGTYGQSCIRECSCGDNGENSTCHHVTGDCVPSQDSFTTFLSTTTLPMTTIGPLGAPAESETDSATDNDEVSTRTTVSNSDFYTALPTRTSVGVTESDSLPSTEKHVLYFGKFTTVVPETTDMTTKFTTVTPTAAHTELPLPTTATTTTTAAATRITTTTTEAAAPPPPSPPSVDLHPKEVEKTTIENEIDENSMTKHSETDKNQETPDEDNSQQNFDKEHVPESTKPDELTKEATTIPHNFQMPPDGIIVVSDGLLSDRRDVEEGEGQKKGSKDSFWDLVSSVSVAGGVALALIVMAAVTLLVSHRRNRKTMDIPQNNKTSSQRRRETELPPPPAPQMYNYTDDVTTLPLRHLFPDVTYQPSGVRPGSDGLQLRFGDVTTTTVNDGQPYNNMRAYLELQYDIPPSSLSSKTNSFQPGVENTFQPSNEPEHLYDEIPCWRSNTTASTNTDTDTSRC